jgi:excisionase family DNA binding protein
MSDSVNLPNLQDHVSIKEAAQMLGLSYKTVHEYVTEGRIKAVRAADVILIPVEEIKRFKPNISGRPRTSIPLWRISPEDNTLLQTSIFVRVKKGKRDAFKKRLEEIRQKKEHLFPGTVARYIVHNNKAPSLIEITLIWRSSVMPNETTRQQALEAFQQALDDVVDWDTARYEDGTVLMHT